MKNYFVAVLFTIFTIVLFLSKGSSYYINDSIRQLDFNKFDDISPIVETFHEIQSQNQFDENNLSIDLDEIDKKLYSETDAVLKLPKSVNLPLPKYNNLNDISPTVETFQEIQSKNQFDENNISIDLEELEKKLSFESEPVLKLPMHVTPPLLKYNHHNIQCETHDDDNLKKISEKSDNKPKIINSPQEFLSNYFSNNNKKLQKTVKIDKLNHEHNGDLLTRKHEKSGNAKDNNLPNQIENVIY